MCSLCSKLLVLITPTGCLEQVESKLFSAFTVLVSVMSLISHLEFILLVFGTLVERLVKEELLHVVLEVVVSHLGGWLTQTVREDGRYVCDRSYCDNLVSCAIQNRILKE